MKVYALVGKSGTGKSYQAMDLCRDRGIEAIIDDGLFIYKNNIVCGSSAKREPTKIGAIKAALFTNDIRRAEAVRNIRETDPKNILILGTSDGMVVKIAQRLDLPEISEMIHIEDITTEDQREEAFKQRNYQGKHVVPVPAAQLKRQFSGYFMDPLRIFRGWGKYKDDVSEKAVVRPTYSYLGNYFISEKVISDIVEYIATDDPEVKEIKKIVTEKRLEELHIRLLCVFGEETVIPKAAAALQKECVKEIEKMTSFNVERLNIEVREMG